MRLSNEVTLSSPPETIFALINDVERVAPCLPGATLDEKAEDGSYRGRVTVKVGPISAAYRGTVRFVETDEQQKRLVLDARGTDQHGSGTAEAKVDVHVRPEGECSVLALDTDLVVRGKVAQFGGGAISQVSQRLMEQFAENLGRLQSEGAAQTAHTPVATSRPGSATQSESAVAPEGQQPSSTGSQLNALSLVLPVVKQYAPTAAALAAGVLAGFIIRPRGRSTLVDERATATIHIGSNNYQVPVRHIVRKGRR